MNILKPRKSRFDEDLASRVNKEVEKKPETAAPEKKSDAMVFHRIREMNWVICPEIRHYNLTWNEAHTKFKEENLMMATPWAFFYYLQHLRQTVEGDCGLTTYPDKTPVAPETALEIIRSYFSGKEQLWLNAEFERSDSGLLMLRGWAYSVHGLRPVEKNYIKTISVADIESINEDGLPTRLSMDDTKNLDYYPPEYDGDVASVYGYRRGKGMSYRCNTSRNSRLALRGALGLNMLVRK